MQTTMNTLLRTRQTYQCDEHTGCQAGLTRRAALVGLGLLAMLTVRGPAMAAPLEAKLRYSLAPKLAPNKVQLVFTLQNESAEPIQVLKWRTPLEGILGPILDVRCNG